jgi:DNA-binding transcriptional regulator LsrR (DeoR family)
MSTQHTKLAWNTLAPYAGRWVAVVRGHVVGVGWTEKEARRAAKRSRPKEEPQVMFVPGCGGLG